MLLAATNKAKRLLQVSYIGRVRAEELTGALEELGSLLADLPPSFRVLADFGRLESMDADSLTILGQVMEKIDEAGAELVVRVIPDPSKDVGVNILSMFHYRKGMRRVTCQTMEDAGRVLGI